MTHPPPAFSFFPPEIFPDLLGVKKEIRLQYKNHLEKKYEIQEKGKDETELFKITGIIQPPSFHIYSFSQQLDTTAPGSELAVTGFW